MLRCKDFPAKDRTAFLSLSRKYEPTEDVLERLNAWISSQRIKILNVETVPHWGCLIFPGFHIRVWYEEQS
jgi:hypothetical protein